MLVLPANAGGIVSLDELSNKAAYVIKSARGYMVYAPQYASDRAWCSTNTTGGASVIEVNEAEANNQWAIYTSKKGFSYMWNVGAKKFLYKKNPATTFSSVPIQGDLNFLASTGNTKAEYPWVLAFGGNQLNMSDNQSASIFSNWNSTSDAGNMVEIRKVADLSSEVLQTIETAVNDFEKDIIVGINSLDQLNANKSYYVMNPRGDWAYVPDYTFDGKPVGSSMLVSSKMPGVAAELPANDKQFAFIQTASGNRYLYSVGAKKYVAVSTNGGNTGAALLDAPVEKLNILNGKGAKLYPWVLALGEHQIGVSPNYKDVGGVITFWNDLADEGNNVMIVEGDNFEVSALVADLNVYEEGLKQALSDALVQAKDVLAKVNAGTLTATEEQKAALINAIDAASAADITKDNYSVLVANLKAAIDAIPQNVAPDSFVCSKIVPVVGEVKVLKDFTLTFVNKASAEDFVGGVDVKKKAILRDADGIAVATGVLSFDAGKSSSEVKVTLDKEISAPGTYTLALRAGSVYNHNFKAEEADFGVAKYGALYNPAADFEYTIAGASVIVNPDPAQGKLAEVPNQITMTFPNAIKSVDMCIVNLGMNNSFMLDEASIAINKNVVTFTLPVEQMKAASNFSMLLEVIDENGDYITYGDYDVDMVYVEYEVAVPSNRFFCKEITPNAGKVESLNKFDLVFYDPTNPWGGFIGGVDESKKVVLRDEYGDVVSNGKVSVNFDDMSSVATIILDSEVTEVGKYTLVVPEGTIYDEGFNGEETDMGVAKFDAIFNPELTYTYEIAGDNVVVSPDPAKGMLKTVPNEISFTFENEIKSVEDAMVVIGMGSVIPVEADQIIINGKVVTVKLPVASLAGVSGFSVSFVATDVDGKVLTYGEAGSGYVGVTYEVEVPANTFVCSQITPAAGEVEMLNNFELTFTNKADAFDFIGGVDETKKIVLRDDDGTAVATGKLNVDLEGFSSVAKVTLNREVTAPGNYTLSIPEAAVYNSSFNAEQEDKGVANFGAIYNPAMEYVYTIKGDDVVINPDPAKGILSEVPKQITLTFAKEIESVDMAMVNLGMNNAFMLAGDQVKVDGKVVTLNLPVEQMVNTASFYILLEVVDVNGDYITYGDYDVDYVFLEYNVEVPANIYKCNSITPAEGAVDSLKIFDLAFVDVSNPWGGQIGGVDESKKVVLKNEAGEVVANGKIAVDYDNMSSIANITLDKVINAAGTYTLVVPEATIYNNSFNADEKDFGVEKFDAIYNPELVFKYTIAAPEPAEVVAVDPDPAKGKLKEVPAKVTFTFSKEIKSAEDAMVIMGPGAVIPVDEIEVKGKQVTVKLPAADMEGLSYFMLSLVVEDVEGNVVEYGEDVEGCVSVSYDIVVPADKYVLVSALPDPKAGEVAELNKFVLTLSNEADPNDFIGSLDDSKKVVLKNKAGEVVANGTASFDASAWNSVVTIELDKVVKEDGTYTLVVPAGLAYNSACDPNSPDFGVNWGAIYNPEIVLTYTVNSALTGIEGAFADDVEVKVYNLKGVLVAKSLKNLPKGIYVVNGKKVYVK